MVGAIQNADNGFVDDRADVDDRFAADVEMMVRRGGQASDEIVFAVAVGKGEGLPGVFIDQIVEFHRERAFADRKVPLASDDLIVIGPILPSFGESDAEGGAD